MSKKRILGIIIAILGGILLLGSFYIKSQVAQGREQIAEGQKRVSQGKKLFSMTPATKEVGKQFSKPMERQIEAGTMRADNYATLALWMQISGVFFIIVGSAIVFVHRKKSA